MMFFFETNLTTMALPTFDNYTVISNPNRKSSSHGGIAVYIKNHLRKNVIDIEYNECYISFRLDIAPDFIFAGTYIQPENSKYLSLQMLADLNALLRKCNQCNYTPFIRGDFNSRLGDMNNLAPSWRYETNRDETTNKHGRIYMRYTITKKRLYPINHLKYKGQTYSGDFTYTKNEKMSQIDFALTNSSGRKLIESFKIMNTNWHISDHKHICLSVNMDTCPSIHVILARAEDMNSEYDPEQMIIRRYNKQYDYNKLEEYITEMKNETETEMTRCLHENDFKSVIEVLNVHLHNAHQISKVKEKRTIDSKKNIMNEVNEKFNNFREAIKDGSNDEIEEKLNIYTTSRKKLTFQILNDEHNRWSETIEKKDSK